MNARYVDNIEFVEKKIDGEMCHFQIDIRACIECSQHKILSKSYFEFVIFKYLENMV
jgi:hypothetical protein